MRLHLLTIIIRCVFSEGSQFYAQLFLDGALYELLQYERIVASEGIDINKTSLSKECELCHYWFFKDVGFKFEEHACNGCHDLLTMAYSLGHIAILHAKGATFRCFLLGNSRNEGLRRLRNSVLEDKGVL